MVDSVAVADLFRRAQQADRDTADRVLLANDSIATSRHILDRVARQPSLLAGSIGASPVQSDTIAERHGA